jgi:hypothetical protein
LLVVSCAAIDDTSDTQAGVEEECNTDDADETDFVYDVYFKAAIPEVGKDGSSWEVGAPVVQVKEDFLSTPP